MHFCLHCSFHQLQNSWFVYFMQYLLYFRILCCVWFLFVLPAGLWNNWPFFWSPRWCHAWAQGFQRLGNLIIDLTQVCLRSSNDSLCYRLCKILIITCNYSLCTHFQPMTLAWRSVQWLHHFIECTYLPIRPLTDSYFGDCDANFVWIKSNIATTQPHAAVSVVLMVWSILASGRPQLC